MLILENKTDACITVNANGCVPLVWKKRGDCIRFEDLKKDYVPYSSAISGFLQAGILSPVKEEVRVEEPLVPPPAPIQSEEPPRDEQQKRRKNRANPQPVIEE